VLDSLDQSPVEIALEARQTAERNFAIAKVIDSLEGILQEAVASYLQEVDDSAQTRLDQACSS